MNSMQEFPEKNSVRLIDCTLDDIRLLIKEEIQRVVGSKSEPELLGGIDGIATIFGCSHSTAQRIKNSGVIDGAISQVGRKIWVDKAEALRLAKTK